VRNGAATIGLCIESLLAQTYPKQLTEVIVVDNGTTDSTREIVAGYAVRLLTETSVSTSYAARNLGISSATGDIIAMTDADCVAAADWLRQLTAPLADDPTAGVVLGAIEDASPESLAEEFTTRVRPFAAPTVRGLRSVLTANVAIRTTTVHQAGCFDERLPTGGDIDLGWRLQQRGVGIRDAPAAKVFHRHRSTFRGVFAQFRRYGLSEVLLTTLYQGNAGSLTRRDQLRRMLSQMRAMASYVAGLCLRSVLSAFRGLDRRYVLWPLFLLTAESGNVVGKLGGLVATRYYRRNPYANPRIVRAWDRGRPARIEVP
jgi:glycosyltransferase involved in cell wall biosynthesis